MPFSNWHFGLVFFLPIKVKGNFFSLTLLNITHDMQKKKLDQHPQNKEIFDPCSSMESVLSPFVPDELVSPIVLRGVGALVHTSKA